MAYTDKDAIYAIAEKLGWSGTEGQTTVEAVYAVAEALGYTGDHDNQVALALSDLYTVVGGGGGGGDLGALQNVPYFTYEEPTVGADMPESQFSLSGVTLGNATAIEVEEYSTLYGVVALAAGFTVIGKYGGRDAAGSSFDGYVVTSDGSGKYATVTPWSGTISVAEDSGTYTVSFEVPELADGSMLVIYNHDDGVSIEV